MRTIQAVCPALHQGKHIQPSTCRVCGALDTKAPRYVRVTIAPTVSDAAIRRLLRKKGEG